MENNKLIAIYGRVSSSNQENEGTIETQLSAVNNFAKENNFIIVKKYTDEGWSGDSIVRPSLDQLRIDSKKKIFEAVLIYDPDRLARRYSYQELLMDELREAGIEVIFVTTPAPKNGVEKVLYGVQGLFAEYERLKIAERFRLGKVRKANEGHIIVSEAPYGYTFILKKGKSGDSDFRQGYYEINEREAQIVKNIFTWVDLEGLRLRGIVKRLQEQGIAPRKSKRGVWSTSTLSTLLRNKTYIGEGHYGASYATIPINPTNKNIYRKIKKTSRKIKPESEWIKIQTPKLIDEDLFNRVGQILKSNFEQSVRNTKNEYLLTSKIWCDCGKRRAGEGPQKGKHLYYRCTDRIKSFPLKSSCKEKGLNARIVDSLVWDKVTEIMSSPELIKQQAERWFNNKKIPSNNLTINIEETKKEVSKLKEQESRYTKAYAESIITISQLKEYIFPLKEKICSFENQLSKINLDDQGVQEKVLPNLNEIEVFTQKASLALKNLSFIAKKAIIINVIDKVVGNNNQLQIYGYIPVTDINVFTINRNCRPTKRREIDSI